MDPRAEVARYARLLYRRGHVTLFAGNVSLRHGDLVAITPTTYPKAFLAPRDVVLIDMEGRVVAGSLRPSSEWRLHVEVYRRRPDVKAVVHTHDVLPTVLADSVDASLLSEAEAYLGGPPSVVPYIRPGTAELAEAAGRALERSNVAILRRHGVVAVGATLAEAVNRVETLDDLARATLYIAMSQCRRVVPRQEG